jgi:hypothetical protein
MQNIYDTLKTINEAFAGSYVEGCFEIQQENEIYFRYDTEDSTGKENWTTYCYISEELASKGYTLTDLYIEHDCITGVVIPIVIDSSKET